MALLGEAPAERRQFPWIPTVVGVVVVVVIVLVIVFDRQTASRQAGHPNPGYVSQVRVTPTRVLEAETMMAGSVIYVDGTVANLGSRPVTALSVRLRFKDPYGQLVQQEQTQVVSASSGLLPPGVTRSFRLGFDHVSAQWNQAPPEALIVSVSTR